jgi:hypothetical protein
MNQITHRTSGSSGRMDITQSVGSKTNTGI